MFASHSTVPGFNLGWNLGMKDLLCPKSLPVHRTRECKEDMLCIRTKGTPWLLAKEALKCILGLCRKMEGLKREVAGGDLSSTFKSPVGYFSL